MVHQIFEVMDGSLRVVDELISFNRLGHYFSGARKVRPYCIQLIFSDLHCLKLSREVGAPLACAREIMSQPII